MKTKITLLSSILVTIFSILFISSCKKDDDNNNTVTNNFSIRFEDGYIGDYGWVVLHSLDGMEVIDYKKIEGDGVTDFGKINGGVVTSTIINIDTSGYYDYYISISSDLSSPCGNWIFRGGNFSDESLGTADITMTYPEGNYSMYMLETTDGWYESDDVPYYGQINHQFNVDRLDEGNKYSLYGAVFTEKGGYCNWLLDQDFIVNTTNHYYLDLNKQLNTKSFETSKPLHFYYIYACWNQRNSNLFLYLDSYYDLQTNHIFIYPFDIPVTDLQFNGYGYDNEYSYSYCKYFNASTGLPDYMEIPNNTIFADYNEITKEIENINITGKADQISGRWHYYNNDSIYIIIYWNVYANWDFTSIKRPVLPQEILDDIGNSINLIEPYGIGLTDYNTTSSHSDIINRFYINDIPVNQRYDEAFYYSYYFNQYKSQDFHQRDREKFETRRHNSRY